MQDNQVYANPALQHDNYSEEELLWVSQSLQSVQLEPCPNCNFIHKLPSAECPCCKGLPLVDKFGKPPSKLWNMSSQPQDVLSTEADEQETLVAAPEVSEVDQLLSKLSIPELWKLSEHAKEAARLREQYLILEPVIKFSSSEYRHSRFQVLPNGAIALIAADYDHFVDAIKLPLLAASQEDAEMLSLRLESLLIRHIPDQDETVWLADGTGRIYTARFDYLQSEHVEMLNLGRVFRDKPQAAAWRDKFATAWRHVFRAASAKVPQIDEAEEPAHDGNRA